MVTRLPHGENVEKPSKINGLIGNLYCGYSMKKLVTCGYEGVNMSGIEKRVSGIYNDCWKNYKTYLGDHDMDAYNKRSEELIIKYGKQRDVVDLILWFAPIVQTIHDKHMKGQK